MSFGFSVGDAVSLGQLAWRTFQNSRAACGEHDELVREVSSLHMVIRRLEQEFSTPESPVNRPNDNCKKELQGIVDGCEKVLKVLNRALEKYNTLSEKERSAKRLWQMLRFGNGKLADMGNLREKLTYYTSALSLFVNMVSMGSIGRVEQQMETAGGDIRKIRIAVNGITAHLLSTSNREGSVLTTYGDDDKAVWKEFRKELIEEGFSSDIIRKHKRLIKAYIKELGDRGLLDDEDPHDGERSSELFSTNLEDLTTPTSGLHSHSKATATPPSETRSKLPTKDQPGSTKTREELPPNDFYDNAPYPEIATPTKPDNAPDTSRLYSFFYKSQSDRAAFKIVKLPDYGPTETVPVYHKYLAAPGDCLTVGNLDRRFSYLPLLPWIIIQRFRARLQILIECHPGTWIFRARKDIDEVRIYVPETINFQLDRDEAMLSATDASKILSRLEGSTNSPNASAHVSMEILEAFLAQCFSPQGYHSQRTRWAHFENDISFDWRLEKHVINENIIDIGEWIRRFDTDCCASAQRLSEAWAKAAQVVTSSAYDGKTSLALLFTDGKHSFELCCNEKSRFLVADYTLSAIWEQHHTSIVLRECEDVISNPSSDDKRFCLEYMVFTKHILLLVVMELEAVDLKGNQARRRERKALVDQADEMLSKIEEMRKSLRSSKWR